MKRSRAYYQYMLDLADQRVSYYSSEDITQIVYDLLDENEAEESLRACQRGLEQHPGDEEIEIVKAKVLLHLKRYDESLRLLDSNAEQHTPFGIGIRFGIEVATCDQRDAFDHLFKALLDAQLTGLEFVEIIDELYDSLPHNLTSEFLFKAAQQLKKMKAEAIGDKPSEMFGRMGALLMDSGYIREASIVLEYSIDYDAYDVYSWQDLTRCQFELGEYDKCMASSEMGLAIDPDNPLFHYALGFIQHKNGDYAASIEHLETARRFFEGHLQHEEINLDKNELEQQTNATYELLGMAYQSTGQSFKARQCYEVLAIRVKGYHEAYYHLAMISLEEGRTPAALEHIDSALLQDPDNTAYLGLKVGILTELKRYEEALSCLDKLIKIDPKSKTYLLAKAELSLNLHNYTEADIAYRKLLKLHPKDATSRALMRNYFEAIGDQEALKKLGN